MNHVIIGSGPAGIYAAESIRYHLPDSDIVMITKDAVAGLSPVMLTYWVGGDTRKGNICFRHPDWSERLGIKTFFNTCVRVVDTEKRLVILENDEPLTFDRLLVATGASAASLPLPGIKTKGVGFFRTLPDAEAFLSGGLDITNVVIIGGGFIGMKLACHLREKNLAVTILEKEDLLAARVLDRHASRLIERHLESKGIIIKTGVSVKNIQHKAGWVCGVSLKSGEWFDAQRVVISVGVRPNCALVSNTAVRTDGGILVDSHMETSIPGIYAAGDVVVMRDYLTGKTTNNATWPAAARQGAVAGMNMSGIPRSYVFNFPINAVNLLGLQVMTAGYPVSDDKEQIEFHFEQNDGTYNKRFCQNGVTKGFILIGDTRSAGRLLSEIKRSGANHISKQSMNKGGSITLPIGGGYAHGKYF